MSAAASNGLPCRTRQCRSSRGKHAFDRLYWRAGWQAQPAPLRYNPTSTGRGRGSTAPSNEKIPRSRSWTIPCARSAPTTSTRATTGVARCRRSAPWGSISRSGSITGACTAIGCRARQAGAGEIRARRAAGLRRQQYPLHHLDQDRRMGARQALPLGAAHPRRRPDPVGFRLGRRAPQALHAVAQAGELQGRADRAARHRQSRLRADGAPCQGDRLADQGGRRLTRCRSASTSSSRR